MGALDKFKKFGRFAARNNPLTAPFFRGRDTPAIREIQNVAIPALATGSGGPIAGVGGRHWGCEDLMPLTAPMQVSRGKELHWNRSARRKTCARVLRMLL